MLIRRDPSDEQEKSAESEILDDDDIIEDNLGHEMWLRGLQSDQSNSARVSLSNLRPPCTPRDHLYIEDWAGFDLATAFEHFETLVGGFMVPDVTSAIKCVQMVLITITKSMILEPHAAVYETTAC